MLADVLLKNFVAAAVFSVSYFLNIVEELSIETCFVTFLGFTIKVTVVHVAV